MFHDDRQTEPRLTIVEQFALGTPLTDAPLGSLVPRSPSFLFVVFLPSFLPSLTLSVFRSKTPDLWKEARPV